MLNGSQSLHHLQLLLSDNLPACPVSGLQSVPAVRACPVLYYTMQQPITHTVKRMWKIPNMKPQRNRDACGVCLAPPEHRLSVSVWVLRSSFALLPFFLLLFLFGSSLSSQIEIHARNFNFQTPKMAMDMDMDMAMILCDAISNSIASDRDEMVSCVRGCGSELE